MNLDNLTTDQLSQMKADKENEILAMGQDINAVEEEYQGIKMKALEIDRVKTETVWKLKLLKNGYRDKNIELDMITSAFWRAKRGI